MVTKFKNQLAKSNLAKNTVSSYVWTVQYFLNHYGEVNKKNLLAYKGYLVENFKPQTVNLRLQGINKYLEFTKQEKLKVKFVKVQQKNFLENVISDADYKFLKAQLKADGYDEWYFIVWFMAATGYVLVNCSTLKRNISRWVISTCIVKVERFDGYTSQRTYEQKPING